MFGVSRVYTATALILGAVAFSLGPEAAVAQTAEVSFTVLGTSTIRSWSCQAPGVVAVSPGNGGAAVPGFPNGAERAVVTVEVEAMKCPDDGMTEHLREAMHPERNPTISFVMGDYTLSGGTARVNGDLTINGVTKSVGFPIQIENGDGGAMSFRGETQVDMTEYDITPPTVLLGALRVRPVVRIRFEGSFR